MFIERYHRSAKDLALGPALKFDTSLSKLLVIDRFYKKEAINVNLVRNSSQQHKKVKQYAARHAHVANHGYKPRSQRH